MYIFAMKNIQDTSGTSGRIALTRRDLIRFEPFLKEILSRFLKFETASLYFPREPMSVRWLPEEGRLFLPLRIKGKQLGVFVAGGVCVSQDVLLLCESLAELCMENVQLRKTAQMDIETGLVARSGGLARISGEIGAIRGAFCPAAREAHGGTEALFEADSSGSRGFFGVLVFHFPGIKDVARSSGHVVAERLLRALADTLWACSPQQALAARSREDEFFLFLPMGTEQSCYELGLEIVQALNEVKVPCEFTGKASVSVAVGYACYPKDMSPSATARKDGEQTRVLLDLAGQAADTAAALFHGNETFKPVMGFGRILAEGGRIIQSLPMGRVRVSLGRAVGAREGQRYAVWGSAPCIKGEQWPPRMRTVKREFRKSSGTRVSNTGPGSETGPGSGLAGAGVVLSALAPRHIAAFEARKDEPVYKGELALCMVRGEDAFAETFSLAEPACPFSPGDRLELLPEDGSMSETAHSGRAQGFVPDRRTGFLQYRDFLPCWAEQRKHCDTFCLGIVRLSCLDSLDRNCTAKVRELMALIAPLCGETLGSEVIAGHYGRNSLIFFHPNCNGQTAQERHARLARVFFKQFGLEAITGIAAYPYLFFRKSDILENCAKALEYALLLPDSEIGVFDSVAMTISADKKFSHGDSFGAIEEYKSALLADESNTTARNSLGVCLAGLGRGSEARRCFEDVLAFEPDNVMAHYNMGRVCQSLGETGQARNEYRKCLALEPEHTFAMLRLGQLAEREKQWDEARNLYQRAAVLPGGGSAPLRFLARLCMREGKEHEAREFLHEALGHNPQDPLSLQLLAHLYLNQGDDPEIAAVLARESIALMPEFAGAWLELARALEACGRIEEARRARLHAAEL